MNVQEQIDLLLAQRAAEWFEIYRTGRREQYPAFVAWLTESPRHLQEFLEIAGRYSAVREVLRAGVVDHDALLRKIAPQARPLRQTPVAAMNKQVSRRMRWRWTAGLTAAAMLAALAIGTLWPSFSFRQTFETVTGEQRSIQLSDGSLLTLNAQSRAAVRFSHTQRSIHLTQGEAIFKVAPDRSRPFMVHTRGATVRAVGTQFNVYARRDGSTTVAVLEGRVEVSGADKSSSPATVKPMQLSIGEAAHVASTGTVERRAHANVSNAVAWRQRRLVFDRTPLESIVQEFNRYNTARKLELIGVRPGSYHFTGSFDADDPASLALLLTKEPLLAVATTEDRIVIRQR